jgi:hypothetical protein
MGLGGPLFFAVLAMLLLMSAFGIVRSRSGSRTVSVLIWLAAVCAWIAVLLWLALIKHWS